MQGSIIYPSKEKTSVITATEHSHPLSATHIETLMVLPKIMNDSSMKDKLSLVRDVPVGFITLDNTLVVIPYICALYPFTNRIVVIPDAGERNHHRVISTSLLLFDFLNGYSECSHRGGYVDVQIWS